MICHKSCIISEIVTDLSLIISFLLLSPILTVLCPLDMVSSDRMSLKITWRQKKIQDLLPQKLSPNLFLATLLTSLQKRPGKSSRIQCITHMARQKTSSLMKLIKKGETLKFIMAFFHITQCVKWSFFVQKLKMLKMYEK